MVVSVLRFRALRTLEQSVSQAVSGVKNTKWLSRCGLWEATVFTDTLLYCCLVVLAMIHNYHTSFPAFSAATGSPADVTIRAGGVLCHGPCSVSDTLTGDHFQRLNVYIALY